MKSSTTTYEKAFYMYDIILRFRSNIKTEDKKHFFKDYLRNKVLDYEEKI